MKVALISFHNAANYGAGLQAFALQCFLESKGIDAEYINYVNQSRHDRYDMMHLMMVSLKSGKFVKAFRYLAGVPFLSLRKSKFNAFYAQYLKQTKKVYSTPEQAKELNDMYDYFIVGSDQVWNPDNNGEDTSYLLSFVTDDRKKISYSSSFGCTEIIPSMKDAYVKCLSSFNHLAVRESGSAKLVKELTGRDAQLVLDPTLLLTKGDWLSICNSKKNQEKYVFTYTNRPGQFAKFLKTTKYKMNGKKEYILSSSTSLANMLSNEKKVMFSMSPSTFVSTINNAELVFTASFHCVAISIVLNKPFVVMLVGDEGKDERILSLLRVTGLTSRIYSENMTEEDVIAPIDYAEVNRRLNDSRDVSVAYLMNCLKQE